MGNKIREFLSKSLNSIPIITAVLVIAGFIGVGAYYFNKNKSKIGISNITSIGQETASDDESDSTASAVTVDNAEQEAIKQNPPKTSTGNMSTKSVSTKSGKAVVVSTGGDGDSDSKVQDYADDGPTSSFAYIDNTGQYPNLGSTLKSYLNSNLLHDDEISYLYEVDVVDCADCDYGGYWTGSYLISGSDITKAYGYITLNVGPYKSSPYVEDYMKLIFSHEYGHHYTMYHRWVDLDLPTGQRFPSEYYTVRPLNSTTTATDYSLGWANCDAEVIAEDYSYFYSGYAYSAVASTHGYPSSPGTKNYLASLSGATSPAVATAEPEPESEPEPAVDTSPPSISISNPTDNDTVFGTIQISASSNDNIGVSKVEFYLDNSLLSNDAVAPYQNSWDTTTASNAQHTIKAKAYDAAGNSATATVTIIVNNQSAEDDQKPSVSIISPTDNPCTWTAADLNIIAEATDNIGVTKVELYINNSLAASVDDNGIYGVWRYATTPAGTYTLKAKAYDAAGNFSESSIVVNKS